MSRPSLPVRRSSVALCAAAFLLVALAVALTGPAPVRGAAVPADCLRAQRQVEHVQGPPEVSGPLAPAARRPTVLGRGAWSYFGDQRAITVGGVVYTGWVTRSGDVVVARFEPGAPHATSKVVIGHTGTDDHNNPSLLPTADGRIVAFFSPHSGRFIPRSGPGHMYYRMTVAPGRFDRWTRTRRVPVNAPGELGFTYPNAIALSNDKTFVAWRGGCWEPTFSIKEGDRWGRAREIVVGPRGARPYAKYGAGPPGSGLVHMCYTERHPNQGHTGVHCLEYRDGRFTRADGTLVAGLRDLPIPTAKGDEVYRFDRRLRQAWVMDVADDGQGHPLVAFSVGNPRGPQHYLFGRWTGTRWRLTQIARAFSDFGGRLEAGGMTIDPNDPYTVYLGRMLDHRIRVEQWSSPDRGRTWQGVRRVSPEGRDCFRPTATAADARTVVLFVCGRSRSWTDFRTTIQAVALDPVALPAAPAPPREGSS